MSTKKKVVTAKVLMSKSTQEEEDENSQFLLEDAGSDLKRAVEVGKDEVLKLERKKDQQVKDYILGGSLDVLLTSERDFDAKVEDVARLERILKERFPNE